MKINTSLSVVIRITLWLIILLGGAMYAYSFDKNNLLFHSPLFHILSAPIGLFILRLAFRAAANGGKELAKGRGKDMPRLETNRLITTGIYKCMRHPMLFGLTLLPIGWALLLGMPTFITIIAPLEMLFIIFMVIIFEEMEVKKKFANEYKDYAKKVPMVSFKRSCLRKVFRKYKR
ncbi:methyltransferase family protein [Sulfurimonas autotrophica]|uniref:Isoprenylcysteine carboxylmethyltransferase family protein n=1 Tax=Sulfurimonas autotrophica (strain ATCC BAA-671 / DSM 16294 / JCM 11897 / OK10) TaxID=563040 RepID=E0UQ50_SULAO|nr:isoprenylcysteine carboxylmethyltransferase family protein [Sulfurimonas autotrophica]ADN08725.1 conserved hypothetical protein [Sulfurimonas autotrophica DSM 16294]